MCFAGYGEPLLRLDTLRETVRLVRETRHGIPWRINTLLLTPNRRKQNRGNKDRALDFIRCSNPDLFLYSCNSRSCGEGPCTPTMCFRDCGLLRLALCVG